MDIEQPIARRSAKLEPSVRVPWTDVLLDSFPDLLASKMVAFLVLLSPLLVLVALLVRLKLCSPVLFRQRRPDLHGKPFTIYKFRTMTDARDAQGNLLLDAQLPDEHSCRQLISREMYV